MQMTLPDLWRRALEPHDHPYIVTARNVLIKRTMRMLRVDDPAGLAIIFPAAWLEAFAWTLAEQGFRFVHRNGRYMWCHPTDVLPTDTDCTELNDDQFAKHVDDHRNDH